MNRDRVILLSDIHFNLNNLKLAAECLKQAIVKSHELGCPLVITGDLNDTKAILRAEVINVLCALFKNAPEFTTILIGNHDLINEKGKEHSLNFLHNYALVVSEPVEMWGYYLIPYQTDKEALRSIIHKVPKGMPIICHQGVLGANMGDYVVDRSSIDPEAFSGHQVFSGHYHRHQTIGPVTYIGSPYTMSFGEANDGRKGFLVVEKDGTYRQVTTNLRKHVVLERNTDTIDDSHHDLNSEDLLWLKVKGPSSWLRKLDKEKLGQFYIGHSNYRLDLIPNDFGPTTELVVKDSSPQELLNGIISLSSASASKKTELQLLAGELLNENT